MTPLVTDFNGDGKLDIVFENMSQQFGIALGNGDGTFQSPTYLTSGALSETVLTVGDFNSDGKVDILASPYPDTADVTLFVGNGDGTFQPVQTVPLGGFNSVGFAVGDFNKDGLMDFTMGLGRNTTVYLQQ